MIRRDFLTHLLAFAPLANLLNAVRKWFAPPPDVVKFPDDAWFAPIMGTTDGDSDIQIDWWPAVQERRVARESDLPSYGFESRRYRMIGEVWHLPLTVPGDGRIISSLQIQISPGGLWMLTLWNAEPYGPFSSNVMLGSTPDVVTHEWLANLVRVLKGDA